MYLYVTGLEIALTMLVAYVQHQSAKNASNWNRTAECFRTFIQTSGGESIDPFGLWRINAKNCTKFLSNSFVTYLGCLITKIK